MKFPKEGGGGAKAVWTFFKKISKFELTVTPWYKLKASQPVDWSAKYSDWRGRRELNSGQILRCKVKLDSNKFKHQVKEPFRNIAKHESMFQNAQSLCMSLLIQQVNWQV